MKIIRREKQRVRVKGEARDIVREEVIAVCANEKHAEILTDMLNERFVGPRAVERHFFTAPDDYELLEIA